MNCPNCRAEYSDQAGVCEFCGQVFQQNSEEIPPALSSLEPNSPPPIPDFSPPVPVSFESDNPYASSDSSTYGSPQLPAHDVPNHLPLSIIAAVLTLCCCCIPFGIVPVIFSTQVKSKLAIGDYAGAQSASDNAKLWAWICIGVALSLFVVNMMMRLATQL